jgi:hypothetical protein
MIVQGLIVLLFVDFLLLSSLSPVLTSPWAIFRHPVLAIPG